MKSNSKAFFKYAKQFRKSKSLIKLLLKEDNSAETDPQKIADMFQHQFVSVFSDPSSSSKTIPLPRNNPHKFESFDITLEDIKSAIDAINSTSSCGDYHIPAILLKSCKDTLAPPIKYLWESSFSKGIIPSFYISQSFIKLITFIKDQLPPKVFQEK